MLYLIGFTIIEACLSMHLTLKKHNRTIPTCCWSLLDANKVMKILTYGYESDLQMVDSLLNSQELQSTNDGGGGDDDDAANHYDILRNVGLEKQEFHTYQKDWILFAVAIDRITFAIFLMLILIIFCLL